jgi:eukaryotic-like serine/threonine-protein kinase
VLGRYVVVRFVGAGGNAEVHAAYDQLLRRTVALKILGGSDGGMDLTRRLSARWAEVLEEAQALARLTHPNVVGVHDVGREGDVSFIAMELVDGVDLSVWRRREGVRMSWREMLKVMLEAGRGLAAAHEQGIVHGDFKPGNVLIDARGRARVVDFGLARIERSTAEPDGAETDPFGGTPAYMAPEQHRGEAPTPASDQYGYCLTLFEMLTDTRPFAEARAKEVGLDRSTAARLPKRVRATVVRGLAPKPADRFSDLPSLLAAIESAMHANRRRSSIAGLALVAIGLASFARHERSTPTCEVASEELAQVWHDARKEAIRASFSASRQPYAGDVLDTTLGRLDRHAEAWLTARRALCEQQEGAVALDRDAYVLRRLCLDAARTGLATAGEILEQANDDVVKQAVQVVASLPSIEACADVEVRAPWRSSPSEETLRAAEAIDSDLARVQVFRAAGRYDRALERARTAAEQAASIDDTATEARARLEVADLEQRRDEPSAIDSFHRAFSIALRAGHYEVLAKVSAALASTVAHDGHFGEAERWLANAAAAADAAGNDDRITAFVENARGRVYGAQGQSREAIAANRRMLEALERVHGPDAEATAVALNNLAVALFGHGEHDEGAMHAERGLGILERELGPWHPRVANTALTLSGIRMRQARYEEASAFAERGALIIERAYGRQHPHYALMLNALATNEGSRSNYEAAAERHRELLALRLETKGPDDLGVASSRTNLGLTLYRLRALASARDELEEARRIFRLSLGEDHPKSAYVETVLGFVAVDEGHAAAAIEPLERALAILTEGEDSDRAMAEFALARALAKSGGDLERARALAERARQVWASVPAYDQHTAEVEAWLHEAQP